jgi:hypothetical protein
MKSNSILELNKNDINQVVGGNINNWIDEKTSAVSASIIKFSKKHPFITAYIIYALTLNILALMAANT